MNYTDAVNLYKERILRKPKITKKSLEMNYFPTPEFISYLMVHLANIKLDDRLLEPSAGTGCISKIFPQGNEAILVEPSITLSALIPKNSSQDIRNHSFESLSILEKFDKIIMNPPFGSHGRKAISHFKKAGLHLNKNGVIVILAPSNIDVEMQIKTNQFNPKFNVSKIIRFNECLFNDVCATINTSIYIYDNSGNDLVEINTESDNINDLILEVEGLCK